MEQGARIDRAGRRPSFAPLMLISTLLVFLAYALTLGIARDLSIQDALVASVANTLPTVGFGLLAYQIVKTRLVGRGIVTQVAGHALLGAVYALLVYWFLMVMLGAVNGVSVVQFNVEPFPVRASAWQLLQNVTIYGIVAALAYHRPADVVAVVLAGDSEAAPTGLSRYFIRSGDDFKPIDVNSIVSIVGADDYAEVRTIAGTHLVRLTLAEFEKSLDPSRFIRVHRSHIVNLNRVARVEPAGGGRMLLHMETGEMIQASRAGSRLLRDRVL